MKELKRISAFFMAMLMMLTVFSAFSVVSAEGEAAGGTQPVWPAPGSIKLDKNAAAVAGAEENLWEVTLGIQGKNFETTSDVVLVIDNSNSMYQNDRMVQTKAAANAFVDALLTQGSATRIAVVVFNLTVNQTGFYDYSNKEELKAYINAVSQNNEDGGTFTQLGIKTARDLLKSPASTGLNKNIVLLSDGVPTKSYRVNSVSANVTGTETSVTSNCGYFSHDAPTVKLNPIYSAEIAGCDYSRIVGKGFEYDYSTSYNVQSRHISTMMRFAVHGLALTDIQTQKHGTMLSTETCQTVQKIRPAASADTLQVRLTSQRSLTQSKLLIILANLQFGKHSRPQTTA